MREPGIIYSQEFHDAVLSFKGHEWLEDEISRADLLYEPMCALIQSVVTLDDKRVLDFGSGTGSSALCLARMGAVHVTGVEPEERAVQIARLRARDCGLLDRLAFQYVLDTRCLPFPNGSFNVVVCYQVLEHVDSGLRRHLIQEMWRVLEPGGYLFVSAPNRLWPHDYHTTRLWLVPWMPLPLAHWWAIKRRRVPVHSTIDELVSRGIHGVTWWEVTGALGDTGSLEWARCPQSAIEEHWRSTIGEARGIRKVAKRLASLLLNVFSLVGASFGIPEGAVLPVLLVCCKKAEGRLRP